LLEIRPSIWRRIEVPETYTFWDLHVAIQDSMGWLDCHLHEFEIPDPDTGEPVRIGIPEEEWDTEQDELLKGWETRIADYFAMDNSVADYTYDFGDGWDHRVRLEAITSRQSGLKYPRCIKGARACPPEDVGGPYGYHDFLHIIKNKRHPRNFELLEWAGGSFDPEHFDATQIYFDNPKTRLNNL
jgi:pRiA4b ORF-3-like protein